MTPAQLRSLLDAATPGPWEPTHGPLYIGSKAVDGWANVAVLCDGGQTAESIVANGKLIIALRNLALPLLDLWEAAILLDGTKPGSKGIAAIEDVWSALAALNETNNQGETK